MDIKNVVSPLTRNGPSDSVKTANNAQPQAAEQRPGLKNAFVKDLSVEKTDSETIAQKTVLDQAVNSVNQLFQAEQRKLSFSVNDATRDVVIEVKDAETDEVIRQIPPEIVVKLAERLQEMSAEESVGILLKDKA
ncbi:flagellar protein FlaG [Methylomonas sp. MgM2]